MEAYVLIVSGRVQGVGFRWFAVNEASRRSIHGYVRNLNDGRVEVWAQAERGRLDEFCERIRRGPSGARVDGVEMRPVAVDQGLDSFEVRF